MEIKLVKDLMIPLSEYATVNEDDTLKTALKTLHDAQAQTSNQTSHYKHRAVLVYDKNRDIVGKIGPLDVLRSLEPKYCKIAHPDQMSRIGLSRFGLSNEFLTSMLDQYCLWEENFEELAKVASTLKVKTVMYSLGEGEYVDENATIVEGIHQLLLGHHQSLLVSRNKKVIGILRLSDVFKMTCDIILAQ